MNRKIISLAKSTNVVTLPSRWCEENSLGKGDEIKVVENRDSVVISPVAMKKDIILDISQMYPMIRRLLGSCFKSGYDEMMISYSTDEELKIAEEVIQQEFIGFEVVSIDNEKRRLIAKSLSEPDIKDFETILRRMMRMVVDMAENIDNNIDDPVKLKEIAEVDKEVNKLADFCRRIINKNSLLKLSERYVRNPPLYFIVEQLEKVSDEFRDLALLGSEGEVIPAQFSNECSSYVKMFYELFYSFSFQSFAEFGKKRYELRDKIDSYVSENGSSRTMTISRNIVEKIFDMNGPLLAVTI